MENKVAQMQRPSSAKQRMKKSGVSHFRPVENQQYNLYYSVTASSLNKRPLAQIYQESTKKGPNGEKRALQNPSTKKSFKFVTSKVENGVKRKSTATAGSHQSDGLVAKRKDELYGRLSSHLLAKFLAQKYTQQVFIKKIKEENQDKIMETGTHFNYVDDGYVTSMAHSVRLNKRPITAKPKEQFGQFTQTLFKINNNQALMEGDTARSSVQQSSVASAPDQSLKQLLNLAHQNVLMIDTRGDGVHCHKEFNEFHIMGSVSFPHGWINRYNHFQALCRFKNLDHKVIVVMDDNERHGSAVTRILTEKGFNNVYLLTGGVQQFFIDYPELIEGHEIPDYYQYKLWVEQSGASPKKKSQ